MPSSDVPVQSSPHSGEPSHTPRVHPVLAMGISVALAGVAGFLSDWGQAGLVLSVCLAFFNGASQRPPS